MKKLRVGLIGAGGFGRLHLQGYSKNENCELIAVASRTEEHAKEAAEKFKIPKFYWGEDWKLMLKENDLDIVSICSPNYLHAPMTLEAIENEINILCEKPICIAQEELKEVEAKLKVKNLIYFSSFQKRYNPIFSNVKKIIDNAILGQLVSIRYYFSHLGPYTSWRPLSKQKWFFDSRMAGGGVALDLAVHCIDILRYLLGEYKRVNGYSSNTICKNIEEEDNCIILVRFENSCLGTITVSWCNEPMETIELFGTEGTLKIDIHAKQPVFHISKKLKKNNMVKELLNYQPAFVNTQNLLIDHFVECVLKGKQEHPNFEDGKRAVECVLEAYSMEKA
ncbi:MAG: Gfo/Idh/MocA family protein [Promethearchaeota archaeon]